MREESAQPIGENCVPPMPQSMFNFLNPTLDGTSDPHRCALDVIATLFYRISFSLDKAGCRLRCTFLDFSSALSTFPRQKIVDSFSLIRAPHYKVGMITNYIFDRKQFVQVGKKSSVIPNDVLAPTQTVFTE